MPDLSLGTLLLHRMEFDRPAQDYQELIHAVESGNISVDAILILILHGVLDKEKVLGQAGDMAYAGSNECRAA